MFNLRKTATNTAAALLVAGTLSGQANDAAAQGFLDLNFCFGNANGRICLDTNGGHGHGHYPYHHGNNGYERRAVEIHRVPYSARCPRGTDTTSIIGNTYPGTREKTKICQQYRMVPKRN